MFHIKVFHHLINSVLTRLISIFFTLLLTFSPIVAQPVYAVATTRYVAPGGSCGGVTPCYSGIQAAVNAAAVGDEIRVATGTYTGVNNLGGKSQHLYVNKNLTITGGYTTSNWTTPDPIANPTELQAQTLGRVVFVAQNVTATLDGLVLTYGNATGLGGHTTIYGTKDAGGALYAYKATLTLNDCRLLHSSTPSSGIGGGLYVRESTLMVDLTRFEDNTAGNGGGAYLYLSNSIVQSSQFVANQMSGLQSGDFALRVEEGALFFTENTVQENFTTSGAGSAVGLGEANFTITQNQILGTTSGSQHESGISLSYSTGVFSENYVASHRNVGVSVSGGYVEMNDNEIAYNKGTPAGSGGGVVFSANPLYASEFTMTGNYIHHNIDNYSYGKGGGVYINAREDNPVYLYYNIIQDNISADGTIMSEYGNGGGVYISNGTYVTLVGNIIQRNYARGKIASTGYFGGQGGGMYINGNATLINNIITDNQARFGGSGVYVNGSTPYLYQNTIANNIYPGGDGSGVYSGESSSNTPGQPRLYNNIITNQTVGIFADKVDVTSLAFVENILWYGNTQNTGGGGTVFINDPHTGDPLYVDVSSYNYRINDGSSAIDIGTNANIPAGTTTDADGSPRIANGTVDLGAYENQSRFLLTSTLSGNGSGTVTSSPTGIDCGSDCTETYDTATVVDLTATPDSVSNFAGWSGDADCADGQVTMNADTSCLASFTRPVTLTVTKIGTGSGTVTSNPPGINCGVDCSEVFNTPTTVNLTATPNVGSAFVKWSGNADCADGQISTTADMTCTAKFNTLLHKTIRSTGAQDGWILESTENSNTGGTMSATAGTLSLGDNAQKKQYRSIFSFVTSSLPDNAIITKVTLKLKHASVLPAGTNPINLMQGIVIDLRKGYFGNAAALQLTDFNATANKTVGPFKPALTAGWYTINLNNTTFAFINKLATNGGLTQIRLRFKLDDNNNAIANILSLVSGNNAAATNRPTLIIEYYVP